MPIDSHEIEKLKLDSRIANVRIKKLKWMSYFCLLYKTEPICSLSKLILVWTIEKSLRIFLRVNKISISKGCIIEQLWFCLNTPYSIIQKTSTKINTVWYLIDSVLQIGVNQRELNLFSSPQIRVLLAVSKIHFIS